MVAQTIPKATAPSAPLWFAKGLLVVIPDDDWPVQYTDVDLAISAADIKTHSGWQNLAQKTAAKDKADECLEAAAILTVLHRYAPGQSVALPIETQLYLSGDFDGDQVLVLQDYPILYSQVFRAYQQEARAERLSKIAKTCTSAWNLKANYLFGRSQQIISTKQQVLENFSTLQAVFYALPEASQKKVAESAFTAIKELQQNNKLDQLPKNSNSNSNSNSNGAVQWFSLLLSSGIKVGTDAYKAKTAIGQYAQVAHTLRKIFGQHRINLQLPYSKSLARKMGQKKLNIKKLNKSLNTNPTLAAVCMKIGLELLREYSCLTPYLEQSSASTPDTIRSKAPPSTKRKGSSKSVHYSAKRIKK